MRVILSKICLASLLLAIAWATPAAAEGESGQTLFEARCSLCHPLERAVAKRKDHVAWSKTVRRMQRYAAGKISDDDVDRIVEYLAREHGQQD